MKKQKIEAFDLQLISFLRRHYLLLARLALFVVFFWFGALKLLGLSPASPLAEALTAQTVGMQYFSELFIALSLIECVIGILFLIPRAIRIVLPLLLVHMAVVCSPLALVSGMVWSAPFVPTLEGQYIIKNAVIVALAIAIAAATPPIKSSRS